MRSLYLVRYVRLGKPRLFKTKRLVRTSAPMHALNIACRPNFPASATASMRYRLVRTSARIRASPCDTAWYARPHARCTHAFARLPQRCSLCCCSATYIDRRLQVGADCIRDEHCDLKLVVEQLLWNANHTMTGRMYRSCPVSSKMITATDTVCVTPPQNAAAPERTYCHKHIERCAVFCKGFLQCTTQARQHALALPSNLGEPFLKGLSLQNHNHILQCAHLR